MKSSVKIFIALAALLVGCGTTTQITSSWRKPNATADSYNHIFVAALSSNIAAKQAVEDGIQQQLQEKGIKVDKGLDAFPPDFNTNSAQRKDLVLSRIKSTGADGILTIALLKEDTETHYRAGSGYWNPGLRYGYYNTFWNYYNNWYPSLYAPDYYDETKVYYLETNLYNAKTEQLIWTAQSKTYDPVSISSFLKGYLKTIREQMVKDGLIHPASQTVAAR
ncbi:hypothetical protein [Mucilaginibacter sp. HD30]